MVNMTLSILKYIRFNKRVILNGAASFNKTIIFFLLKPKERVERCVEKQSAITEVINEPTKRDNSEFVTEAFSTITKRSAVKEPMIKEREPFVY